MEPSDFSCYLHDGIDDERQFYKLEQLSITGCPKITYRIIYALQQGTHNIQFLQFDNNFTEFQITQLRDHRPDLFISLSGMQQNYEHVIRYQTPADAIRYEELRQK